MFKAALLAGTILSGLTLQSTAVIAQQLSPANVGTDRAATPQPFSLLDKAGNWLPIGQGGGGQFFPAQSFFAEAYAPPHNWADDDGPAIANAITAAKNAGGGTVWLAPKAYWNKTQSLIIPPHVRVACMGGFTKSSPNWDFTNRPCTIYQASGKGPIVVYGAFQDAGLQADFTHFMLRDTRAHVQAYIAAYTGVGVQIGLADGGQSGMQAVVQNVAIGGFTTCVKQDGANQVQLRQILGDCTNGLDVAHSYDNNFFSDNEFWEFLTTAWSTGTKQWNVTALADNGAGSWRLTIATSTDPPQTGEQLLYYPGLGGVGSYPGGSGAQGLWTVTAVDGTHVDLQNSRVTPTGITGTTNTGRTFVALSTTDDLAPGMNVSGPGILAGAKIAAVWRSRPAISLDQAHPATAPGTNVALTFTNDPYSGTGGSLEYDQNYRSGVGFAIGHADGTSCSGCFAFGYRVGFNFRGGSFNNFTNSNVDGLAHLMPNKNVVPVALQFTGDASATYFQAAAITSASVHVLNNATPSGPGGANVADTLFPAGATQSGTFLEDASGGLAFKSMSTTYGGNILLAVGASAPVFSSLNLPNAYVFSDLAQPNWIGQATFGGALESRGQVFSGAQAFVAAAPGGADFTTYDPNGAADNKRWRWRGSANSMCLSLVNDANNAATNVICYGRSVMTPTPIVTAADYNLSGIMNATSFKAAGVAGFTGSKTAGSCVFTISGGIITNVTGC